jgi:hypothetical protein
VSLSKTSEANPLPLSTGEGGEVEFRKASDDHGAQENGLEHKMFLISSLRESEILPLGRISPK